MSDTQKPVLSRPTLAPMTFSINTNNKIIKCNHKFAHALGYDRSEAISMSVFNCIPKAEHSVLDDILVRCASNKTVQGRKLTLLARDGQTFEAMMTMMEVTYSDGSPKQYNITLLNYKELQNMQEKVKISKYKSLYEDSPDMYRTVNIDGTIIDCNKAYAEKLGYTKDEVIGHKLEEHTAEYNVTTMLNNMSNWRKDGICNPTKIHLKKKDNSEFLALVSPTNLYDYDGALLGRNVVIHDMSELEKQKNILHEKKLVEQMKDEFLVNMNHQLKTHLTPIIGFSQALTNQNLLGTLNEKQLEIVQNILNNAVNLRQLLTDMIQRKDVELGEMAITHEKFAVSDMIQEIKPKVESAAEKKSLKVIFDVQFKDEVVGDKTHTYKILINLIYSVIDFTRQNAGQIYITISRKDGLLEFKITSNNVHMYKTEDSDDLLNKFNQLYMSMPHSSNESDLSLLTCKSMAEHLGGTLGILNVDAHHTMFYFTVHIQST